MKIDHTTQPNKGGGVNTQLFLRQQAKEKGGVALDCKMQGDMYAIMTADVMI